MTERDLILLKYSLVEWLWQNGVEAETTEEAGNAWATPAKTLAKPTPTLDNSPGTPFKAFPSDMGFENLGTLSEFNDYMVDWKGTGLAKTAYSTVLGTGALQPRLMIVADMPDDSEDLSAKAFTSGYNLLVLRALAAIGLDDGVLYKTYLSKWRTPSRRTLSAMETTICGQMLRHEINLVAPQAILTLGESACRALMGDSWGGETRFRPDNNFVFQHNNIPLPMMSSHKGEFLVKNPAMKKNFWFSLVNFAEAMRTFSHQPTCVPDVNNAEYISDV